MPVPYDASDPFSGSERIPSLSWRSLPVGSEFTLKIVEPAKLLQSRDFDTNLPAFWDEAKTQPIMSAVLNVEVMAGPHSVGELRSVWAQRPSNLFAAISDAQKAVQARIDTGGTLRLRFAGEKPHEDKRMNPIKQYQAHYTPPVVDAFTAPSIVTQTPPPPGMQSWPPRPQTPQGTTAAGTPPSAAVTW